MTPPPQKNEGRLAAAFVVLPAVAGPAQSGRFTNSIELSFVRLSVVEV